MKKTALFIAAMSLLLFTSKAQKQVRTKVNSATVFFNGAEILRTVTVNLSKGENKIEFTEIESMIHPQTLVVGSNEPIAILTSTHTNVSRTGVYVQNSHQKILDSIKLLDAFKAQLSEEAGNLQSEKKMILANKMVGGSQTGINVDNLKALADFYRNRLNEIDVKLRNIANKQERTSTDRTKLNKKLVDKGYTPAMGVISSTIVSEKATSATIQLKYTVGTVYWQPYYDIHATALNKPLKITTKAKVMQSSGVSWEKVKLTLSTTMPVQYGQKPVITPWVLQLYEYGKTAYRKKQMAPNFGGVTYTYDADVTFRGNSLTAKEFTTVQNNLIAREFNIGVPYSVKHQGTAVMELEDKLAETDFYYYAAPKIDKKVYLLGDVSEWEKLDLIQGEANIYLEGNFMGTTFINPMSTDDTLSLMIGQDQELQTDRRKLDELCKNSTFGANKKTQMAMEVIVKNNKSVPVKIILEDQVPITYTDKIEITVEEVSGAKHLKETGLLTWEFTLAPDEQQKKQIKYLVKHPKKMRINL